MCVRRRRAMLVAPVRQAAISNGNATHLNHLAPPHAAILLASRAGVGRVRGDKNVGRRENAYSNVWMAAGLGRPVRDSVAGIGDESGYPAAVARFLETRRA